jgi:integrase-like protein
VTVKRAVRHVPGAKDLKRSTRQGYRLIIGRHLVPALGTRKLDRLDAGDLEQYIARKRREGLGPRTINCYLHLLNELFVAAAKRRPPLARSNPCSGLTRRDHVSGNGDLHPGLGAEGSERLA